MRVKERELDLDWVTPLLAVGGSYPMDAAAHLAQKLGVRHVVDVRVECRDDEHVLRKHGITFLHLPTVDMRAIQSRMIHDGVEWVRERLANEQKVLIHCEHGIGRSALLTLCVLVDQGMEPLAALDLAKTRRPCVSPSPEQLGAFIAYTRDVHARGAVPWPVPTLEALGTIAYRHLRACLETS
ncbi:protein phosphatase [Corallococcus exercitus]|uniref:Dual specificity protein phosphatase family protein n=2 Tax=Corallococcus exercitus TaxID=2316736 RepID=A0A3A8I024_9BACT|nr:dual specificity protein phosphatase [Corallococcus exercitus]NOK37848.1 dual specificity protein phosphatase family protein [Corallococcus exercitus]RKG73184.1 protein phosphatase [Corallococcus exercitus]